MRGGINESDKEQELIFVVRNIKDYDLTAGEWAELEDSNEHQSVKELRKFLSQNIRGQDRAVEAICKAYEDFVNGIMAEDRPIAVILFLGPSRHGKTEIVLRFAEFLHGSRDAVYILDGSDYQHESDVNNLKGAPPAFIRSDEMPGLSQENLEEPARKYSPIAQAMKQNEKRYNRLDSLRKSKKTELSNVDKGLENIKLSADGYSKLEIRRQTVLDKINELDEELYDLAEKWDALQKQSPEFFVNVLLIDELEEADRSLIGLFLQILDKARLTVSVPKKGRVATRFHRTFIFMTSNVGMEEIKNLLTEKSMGFRSLDTKNKKTDHDIAQTAMKAARKKFPLKFLNRIDKIVVFRPFTDETLRQICIDNLENLQIELINEFGCAVTFSNKIVEFLVAEAKEHPEEGVKALKNKIESRIRRPLFRRGRGGKIQKADVIFIDLAEDNENVVFFYNVDLRKDKQLLLDPGQIDRVSDTNQNTDSSSEG